MGRVFRQFFEDLFRGDAVALIIAAVLGAITLFLLLFWWKTARDLRREDEERKQRQSLGRKKKL